jgi:DNA-binding LacI/PurR family transcriptional regulator
VTSQAERPDRRGSKRRHPTIVDVAERAGVSKSLVSLVMRGAPNVSDEKRDAVARAAEEIGYRPNAVARSLVRRRSFVIGVMVSDLHNPYFTEVIDGIEVAARAAGYRALFNSGERTAAGETEAIDTLLQLRTDGVVMAGPVLATRKIAHVAASVPVVVIAGHSRSPAHDSITNDDHLGAGLAVDHLVALGHRHIAHVDGGTGAGAAQRLAGFLEAMERHGLRTSATVVPGSFTEDGGREGVTALLRERDGVTGVFVANDLAAVGALDALHHQGLRVPEDVSLVGYDNIALAGLGHINLTTIDQPRREMGVTAVRLLLERRDEDRSTARHLVVPPSLVVRRSTGPPPKGGAGVRRLTRSTDRADRPPLDDV